MLSFDDISLVAGILLGIISLEHRPTPPRPRQPPPKPTGLVFHEACLKHDTGPEHPEIPARIKAIISQLRAKGLYDRLALLTPAPARREWISAVHTTEYIEALERAVNDGAAYMHSSDTPLSPGSYQAALLAAGAVITAIDAVMAEKIANAFCAIRPPGHHAMPDRAMGFCLLNNAAIGARYLQSKYGLKRIMIVDWDVHHGNGTQAVFEDDPNVLFFSIHQHPFYPGTGIAEETGRGPGKGFTVNVPLPAGSGDREYIAAFENILRPRAMTFRPEFILISAGFDSHANDPLGGMQVTADGFAQLTRIVRQIAAQTCQGRLVSILEGGYHIENLPETIIAHLTELMPP